LYERGYGKDEIRVLFEFIDWVLQLSEEEEDLIWEEIREHEEAKGMPYITSVERIGMRKGMEKGLQQGLQQGLLEDGREMVLEALDERFGEVSDEISNAVNQLEDRDTLKFLHRYVIRCASLEEFKQVLNGQ
jgi:flagellar biosynthesis/type III secretory pathway protein FliH